MKGSAAAVGGKEEGLRALGSFVHDTALLEGAVDGVERGGKGGTAMSTGAAAGVFVKASWSALPCCSSSLKYLQTYGVRTSAVAPPCVVARCWKRRCWLAKALC